MADTQSAQPQLFDVAELPGRPMLHWHGKRPLREIPYYPAQLRERYGDLPADAEPTEAWGNRLYWGDNLQVMAHLMREFRGQIKLIYIDPPFDSGADYRKRVKLRGTSVQTDLNVLEERQYTDIWSNDLYLQYMYERLILMRELLAEDGSIYLHCDWHRGHYLRCILDEVFGESNFRNEIIRVKSNPKNYTTRGFGNQHDAILFYSKSDEIIWNRPFKERTREAIERDFPLIEERTGRRYKTVPLHAPGIRHGPTGEPWKGLMPPSGNHWRYVPETLERLDRDGLIEWSETGNPRKKVYADESPGVFLQDIWDDCKDVVAVEYPTQKNELLLERIVNASSCPGDLIADFFIGSGTTAAVAQRLGRPAGSAPTSTWGPSTPLPNAWPASLRNTKIRPSSWNWAKSHPASTPSSKSTTSTTTRSSRTPKRPGTSCSNSMAWNPSRAIAFSTAPWTDAGSRW